MGYRILPNGSIECDDAMQALDIQEEIQRRQERAQREKRALRAAVDQQAETHRPPPPRVEPTEQIDVREAWPIFWGRLADQEKKLLQAVAQHDLGIDLDSLRKVVGLNTNKGLGGVLAGLTKQLRTARFPEDAVLRRSQEGSGAKRVTRYHPGPLLKERRKLGMDTG